MKIKEITIRNFRGIDELKKLQVSDLNTFVGKNDSGKSCILQALNCFFNEKNFDSKDFFKGRKENEKTFIEVSFYLPYNIDDLALDSEKNITLKKEYEINSGKIKIITNYKCFDYIDPKYQNLWNKKEEELNALIQELHLTPEKSGRGKKNIVRINQIKEALSSVKREDHYYLLEDFQKNLEKTYDDFSYPEYTLFEAEQNLSIESTGFQSQFKPLISAFFEKTQSKTVEIENGLKESLAVEFEEIRKFMEKNVPSLKKFNPTTEFDWSKSLKKFDLNLEFEGDLYDVPISHKGTGFKRLLMVAYFEYLAKKKAAKNQIFAIEEPETYLHPAAQNDLLNSIIEISENSQFFLTTHSPIFAGATNGENSVLVTKDEKNISQYERGTADIIQKIIKELGIKPDYNLITKSRFLLFVEGPDDVRFIRLAAKNLLNKDLIDDGIACIIGQGCTLVNYVDLDLFKQVNGSNYCVLVDGDNGNEQKNREKSKIESKCAEDKALFYKFSKRDIENYCDPERIKESYIEKITQSGGSQQFKQRIEEIKKLQLKIDLDTDVEEYLKEKGLINFKKGYNIRTFELMTVNDWNEMDKFGEIKKCIEQIYSTLR